MRPEEPSGCTKDIGRPSTTCPTLVRLAFLQRRPMVTSKMLVEEISISAPTANNALSALVAAGIIEEITGKKRGRVYAYRGYIQALAAAAD